MKTPSWAQVALPAAFEENSIIVKLTEFSLKFNKFKKWWSSQKFEIIPSFTTIQKILKMFTQYWEF